MRPAAHACRVSRGAQTVPAAVLTPQQLSTQKTCYFDLLIWFLKRTKASLGDPAGAGHEPGFVGGVSAWAAVMRVERGSSERLCWGGGGVLHAWLLRACLRAAVGRGLVWARGRRRSCAAVSPGKIGRRRLDRPHAGCI